MGAMGGLYRPTPRGTMVISLDVGPIRQCLWWPASPPAAGARRLVGPAGCLVLAQQAAPAAGGSCRLLSTVAERLMMLALSGKAWLQSRHLVGVHCSHSPSLLINGARTPREGEGRLVRSQPPPEPTGRGSPPSGFSRTGRARCLWAVPTTRCGSMAPSDKVMSWVAWQQCRAGWEISVWYVALWPCLALELEAARRAVATPLSCPS